MESLVKPRQIEKRAEDALQLKENLGFQLLAVKSRSRRSLAVFGWWLQNATVFPTESNCPVAVSSSVSSCLLRVTQHLQPPSSCQKVI